MITIYKKINKNTPYELITLNDVYFNKYTADKLDERASEVILKIDQSKVIDKYTIESKFDGSFLNIDKLSTGCKTVLNIMYNPEVIFDLRECGENALDMIYLLEHGRVYCEYPVISFNMTKVKVADLKDEQIISDYEELKEWWKK